MILLHNYYFKLKTWNCITCTFTLLNLIIYLTVSFLQTHIYELQTYFQYLESNQNRNILFKCKLDRLKTEIETLGTFKLLLLASVTKKANEIDEIQCEIYGEDVVRAAYQQQEQQQQQVEDQQQQQEHHQPQNVQLMM